MQGSVHRLGLKVCGVILGNRNAYSSIPGRHLDPVAIPRRTSQLDMYATVDRGSGYLTRQAREMNAAVGRLKLQSSANIRYFDPSVDRLHGQIGWLRDENLETD